MARQKNANWNIKDPPDDWIQVLAILLMDLRDELQEIKQELRSMRIVLQCPNMQKAALAVQRTDKRLAKRTKLK